MKRYIKADSIDDMPIRLYILVDWNGIEYIPVCKFYARNGYNADDQLRCIQKFYPDTFDSCQIGSGRDIIDLEEAYETVKKYRDLFAFADEYAENLDIEFVGDPQEYQSAKEILRY